MWFKISYVIYLIVCLLFGNIELFPSLSIRHILTFYMLVCCIVQGGIKINRFIRAYLIFLLFYGISSIFTGYGLVFLRNLIGTFFAAIVIYWSTKILFQKYDGGIWMINAVLAVAVINSIIAIGQFYQNPQALAITSFFRFNMGEDVVEMYEQAKDFHGRYVSGMMDVVSSGYFMSAASVVALYNKEGKLSIRNILTFALIFYSLFLGQERAGFYCGILCVALYLLIMIGRNETSVLSIFFLLVIGLFVIQHYGGYLFSLDDMRYKSVEDSGLRGRLIQNGWHYFMDHPFGAYLQWVFEGHEQAHNVFINSLLMGGIIGGVVGIAIIICQLVKVAKILLESLKKEYSTMLVVLALAFLDYTMNSFFHNPSVLGGVAMYFVLWGGVTSLYGWEGADRQNKLLSRKVMLYNT